MMTYQQLLDSHFLQHPTHSKIVHAVFNPFITMAMVSIGAALVAFMLEGSIAMSITCLLFPLFVGSKMTLAFNCLSGHGVGLIKKGPFSLLGLNTAASIIMVILGSLLIALVVVTFKLSSGLHPQDTLRLQLFAGTMMTAFVTSLLSWRFHTYYETYYGSEYSARVEFKQKEYNQEETEEKIAALRKKGILPWR